MERIRLLNVNLRCKPFISGMMYPYPNEDRTPSGLRPRCACYSGEKRGHDESFRIRPEIVKRIHREPGNELTTERPKARDGMHISK